MKEKLRRARRGELTDRCFAETCSSVPKSADQRFTREAITFSLIVRPFQHLGMGIILPLLRLPHSAFLARAAGINDLTAYYVDFLGSIGRRRGNIQEKGKRKKGRVRYQNDEFIDATHMIDQRVGSC